MNKPMTVLEDKDGTYTLSAMTSYDFGKIIKSTTTHNVHNRIEYIVRRLKDEGKNTSLLFQEFTYKPTDKRTFHYYHISRDGLKLLIKKYTKYRQRKFLDIADENLATTPEIRSKMYYDTSFEYQHQYKVVTPTDHVKFFLKECFIVDKYHKHDFYTAQELLGMFKIHSDMNNIIHNVNVRDFYRLISEILHWGYSKNCKDDEGNIFRGYRGLILKDCGQKIFNML